MKFIKVNAKISEKPEYSKTIINADSIVYIETSCNGIMITLSDREWFELDMSIDEFWKILSA